MTNDFKHRLPNGVRHIESHPAEIAGVKGEVHILLHPQLIYEAVFECEIATQPCHIGEAFRHKPSKAQIKQAQVNFKPYIERQKDLRRGWN